MVSNMIYWEGLMRRKIKLWLALIVLAVVTIVAAFALSVRAKEAEQARKNEEIKLVLAKISHNTPAEDSTESNSYQSALQKSLAEYEQFEPDTSNSTAAQQPSNNSAELQIAKDYLLLQKILEATQQYSSQKQASEVAGTAIETASLAEQSIPVNYEFLQSTEINQSLAEGAADFMIAAGVSPTSAFFWGGEIEATIPCVRLPNGVCPCDGIVACPCSPGPAYFKVFMDPDYGGILPEPAYCHPAGLPVFYDSLIPTPPPAALAPGLQIIGLGITELLPLYVGTTAE